MAMTIALDDLEQRCWECNGSGRVPAVDGERTAGERNDGERVCPKCGGKGVVLTALGQTLLDFIRRHL
jgi:DnaJ-class molecular chaperone